MLQSEQVLYFERSRPDWSMHVIQGGIGLVPGTGRYSVAASIAGDPASTVCGEFAQHPEGSVLTARTAPEHLGIISALHTAILNMVISDAEGLSIEETEDVGAAAFLGIELHQLLLLTGQAGVEIDQAIYDDVCSTLMVLRRQLEHFREVHRRGHKRDVPYLPEYFKFLDENPIPGDDGDS